MAFHIVVAHDLGPVGDSALAWAATFAQRCGGTLGVVHVAPAPPSLTPLPSPDSRIADSRDLELLRVRLHDLLQRKGWTASVEVLEGRDPAASIVAAAQRDSADLIVVGTHGRTGVRRALLGSVAESVIRIAPCPVVTVRAGG